MSSLSCDLTIEELHQLSDRSFNINVIKKYKVIVLDQLLMSKRMVPLCKLLDSIEVSVKFLLLLIHL